MSYKIKYTIPFKTISNKDCLIKIEVKDYLGEQMELTAGGDPIKIETDTADLLSPIRSSLATISVYGSDYLQDLYASDPQGIKITLLIDGAVYWLGYATPDTFSQNFSSPEFIYELEAVAALSTLKYKNFDLTADFVSFSEIINKAIEYSGYSGYYLTNSITADTESFYSLRIASANFFDELGEAMTYYEVLEEIAKYAGCCWTPYGSKLYLIDYQAIKAGYNSYTELTGLTTSTVTLSDAKTVSNYKGTGAKLSRIAGKNKASVKCSLYEIKDLLPTFDDKETVFIRPYNAAGFIARYYKHPKHFFYTYTEEGTEIVVTETHDPINTSSAGSSFTRVSEYDSKNVPSKLSFTNDLIVRTILGADLSNAVKILGSTDRIIRMISDKPILVHSNVWFCISFRFKRTSDLGFPDNFDYKYSADTVINHKASLRIGNLYFNGTGWSETVSTFNIPMTAKKDTPILNNYLSVDNNNTYDKGLGDLSGFTFKAPDTVVTGEMEFILYSKSPDLNPYSTMDCTRVHHYQEIQIGYGIPSAESVYNDYSDTKNDVLYENVIDAGFIDEADEIDLKICTNVDGKLALSSVISGTNFLETLTSDVFGTDVAENILLNRVIDLFETPRFIIDPTLNNNLKPYSVMTEPNLNKVFMVAGGDEDVKMESCTYNLIEI